MYSKKKLFFTCIASKGLQLFANVIILIPYYALTILWGNRSINLALYNRTVGSDFPWTAITRASLLSRVRYVGSKSVEIFPFFSLVGDLGEITCKKQEWSNAKAFRAIDRAADVLQIGQVPFQAFAFLSLRTRCSLLDKISNYHAENILPMF